MDAQYKMKYAKNIWEQVENGIRSSAYTGKLSVFLEKVSRKLGVTLTKEFRLPVMEVIESGQDEEILNWLRYEATFLATYAALLHQDYKATLPAKKDSFDFE